MLVGTLLVGFAHDCRFVGLIFVIIIVGLSWRCRIACDDKNSPSSAGVIWPWSIVRDRVGCSAASKRFALVSQNLQHFRTDSLVASSVATRVYAERP
jgi:hypothetical protein